METKMKRSQTPHIIIVTWNAIEYTKAALESVFRYTDLKYYLTVVDNGSTDGTITYLDNLSISPLCAEFKIIKNRKNLGYGGAIVQGYNSRKCEFVCIINNDIICSPG